MENPEAERFDGILMNIAQQSGSIESILDTFFGFLQRKTDFFTGCQDEKAAEQLVLKYYKKHWEASRKRREEQQEQNRLADEERKRRRDEQKRKDEEDYKKRQDEIAKKQREAQETKIQEVTDEEAAAIKAEKEGKPADASASAASAPASASGAEDEKQEDKEEGEDKEPPPPGNGGKTDKYTWTQTLGALEVYIDVRPGVKAKQIVCDIGNDTLKVGIKGEAMILDGKMHAKVKPDDCTWTLIDNKVVQVSIEKFDAMKWWNCVMQGDPGIDTKKIVPENSKLSDLDGETRMTVEKMMYDQRQKALGKPTSDQEKQHDLLEKFKAAHPEMDFSKAKINYGGQGGGFNFGG